MHYTNKIMNFVIVIPARYASGRFPGKPLADINGLPMILRTYNQCLKATNKKKIFVATDDLRIKNLCKSKLEKIFFNFFFTINHTLKKNPY